MRLYNLGDKSIETDFRLTLFFVFLAYQLDVQPDVQYLNLQSSLSE